MSSDPQLSRPTLPTTYNYRHVQTCSKASSEESSFPAFSCTTPGTRLSGCELLRWHGCRRWHGYRWRQWQRWGGHQCERCGCLRLLLQPLQPGLIAICLQTQMEDRLVLHLRHLRLEVIPLLLDCLTRARTHK
eukprot:7387991-Prymnesium_polylepis.3